MVEIKCRGVLMGLGWAGVVRFADLMVEFQCKRYNMSQDVFFFSPGPKP